MNRSKIERKMKSKTSSRKPPKRTYLSSRKISSRNSRTLSRTSAFTPLIARSIPKKNLRKYCCWKPNSPSKSKWPPAINRLKWISIDQIANWNWRKKRRSRNKVWTVIKSFSSRRKMRPRKSQRRMECLAQQIFRVLMWGRNGTTQNRPRRLK